jgi:hypothetical protein
LPVADVVDLEVRAIDRELRQAIAELSLVSHGPTMAWGRTARDTSEAIGGRRPGSTDEEYRPKDLAERCAWDESYHRKTVAWFQGQREEAADDPERLAVLRDDCRRVVEAWRRRPLVNGQAPARADPEWKRYIAECGLDSGDLARQYGCTRRYINMLKAMAWSASEEPNAEFERLRLAVAVS